MQHFVGLFLLGLFTSCAQTEGESFILFSVVSRFLSVIVAVNKSCLMSQIYGTQKMSK